MFTNGSFETSVAIPGQFTTVNAVNSTAITGWAVASGSIDYISTYWNAQSGSGNVGVVQQTFDTINGTKYNVKFFLGGNSFSGPPVKTLTVSAGAGNLILGSPARITASTRLVPRRSPK